LLENLSIASNFDCAIYSFDCADGFLARSI
jgi:hypothetical protein